MNNNENILVARASPAGYIIFCGLFSTLGLISITSSITRNNIDYEGVTVSLACFLGAGLWASWLRGHKLIINEDTISYRDGLYRTKEGPLSKVRSIKHAWIRYQYLWRKLEMPRLVIRFHDRNIPPILINAKPFSRDDLKKLEEIVERKRAAVTG